jgi:hypothetical protein
MQASRDIDILARARDEDRVIVSADSDFGVLLASHAVSHPSFILFRKPNLLRAQDYIDLLLPVLLRSSPNWRADVWQFFATTDSEFESCRSRIRDEGVGLLDVPCLKNYPSATSQAPPRC